MRHWDLKKIGFKHIDSIIAGIIGFFIVYFSIAAEKLAISTDSIVYIHAAREMYQHHVFTEFNGHPLVDFPFFYPFILSLFIFLTHTDLIAFVPFLNGGLFALVVLLSGIIIEKTNPSNKVFKWLILAIILSSPALLQVFFALWSETLFIPEVLLFIIATHFYHSHYSARALFYYILITSIACITRYAGIVLIGSGCLLLLIDKKPTLRRKFIHGSIFITGSSSLFLINIIRNYMVSGTATGTRQHGNTSLDINISHYGNVISKWLPYLKHHVFLSIVVGIVVLIVLTCIAIWNYRKIQALDYITILALFVLVYSYFFILISTLLKFEQIDNRFLSPLFIPLLIIVTSWVPSFIHSIKINWRNWLIAGLLILFIIQFIFQLQNDQFITNSYNISNIPIYSDSIWKRSEIANYIKLHKDIFNSHYSIYSNASEAAYFFGGLSTDRIPQKINKQEISDFLDQDSIFVIWFNRIRATDQISDSFILDNKDIKPLRKFNDGTIYVSVDEDE